VNRANAKDALNYESAALKKKKKKNRQRGIASLDGMRNAISLYCRHIIARVVCVAA
jgi:hypothetical protein